MRRFSVVGGSIVLRLGLLMRMRVVVVVVW